MVSIFRVAPWILGAALSWSAAAAPQVFVPVTGAKAAPAARAGARAVRFNQQELMALAPGAVVELTLPDASRQSYIYERTLSHGGGLATWIARADVSGDSERVVLTTSPSGTWGWLKTAHGEWRVYPGGANDWLVKRAPASLAPIDGGSDAVPAPPDIDAAVGPLKGIPTAIGPAAIDASRGAAKAAPGDNRQVDVMIIYTKDLAEKLGTGLMPMLYNLVATANQAYIDSEVALTLRLVNTTMLDYPNANGSAETLDGMLGQGPFASTFQGLTWQAGSSTRDVFGADLVAMVRDGPSDTGGIGFLPRNPSLYPTVSVVSSAGYSISNYCASGCEGTFVHELGHNMGNAHDIATIARDNAGVIPSVNGVFSYSLGYYSCSSGLSCNPFAADGCPTAYAQCATPNANDFGTVMSYVYPRVMKFSNPSILCVPTGGATPGRPCGAAGTADNALSMNNTRQNISAYRNQQIASLPGSVQFTTNGYSGAEAGGGVTFSVSRVNGSSGAISVTYTVTGATATPGVDFIAASGTLSWASGDASNKTFSVTLADDLAAEGVESFTATLSNPAGAGGVYLGHPVAATGLILETWPPGGAFPPGWISGVDSAPWAVASDSNFDGDATSMKSGVLDFAVKNCTDPLFGAVPCPSSLRYSGTFAAGIVAYAYRVNGFPGYGFFEFLVDGAVVQSDTSSEPTADTGWRIYSTPITAGAHTLTWRYRTRFPFPCASAIPAGSSSPPHPGCIDRAWLDSVSLPEALAPSTTSLSSNVNPSTTGQTVTFTAVTVGGGGTVAFRDGATVIAGCGARPVAGGIATCVTSALAAGSRSITAAYSGSPIYASSTSPPLIQTVAAAPDMGVTQVASPGTTTAGKDVVFTITATNGFTSTVTGVTLTDTIPFGASFVWASPGCNFSLGTVICTIGTLNGGASAQRKIVVRPGVAGTATNTVAVSMSQADSNPANNADSLGVQIDAAPVPAAVLRYRLYSPVTLEHHFTTDLNEYNVLGAQGGWQQEGTVGKVLNNPGVFNGVTAVPYYRLYNDFNHWHHWTTDANEYYTLMTFPGWNGEGVDGYLLPTGTSGAMQLYRLVYPNGTGLHHWTVDANEYTTLIASFGWVGEGGAGFVIQ